MIVYLARYYRDSKYVKDTLVINAEAKFTIEVRKD